MVVVKVISLAVSHIQKLLGAMQLSASKLARENTAINQSLAEEMALSSINNYQFV